MIAIDTNVQIHAHREEMPLHDAALGLLRKLAEGGNPWGIPVPCLAEFVRVVTHPRVFAPPSDLSIAFEFLERLLASPSARLLLIHMAVKRLVELRHEGLPERPS